MAEADNRQVRLIRTEARLEVAVIFAALATIPLTILQAQDVTGPFVAAADWTVWAIFTVEYVVMVTLVSDRWGYTRRNWFNVTIIVLSFPLLHELLALTRLLRLARLSRIVRLVRLAAVTGRGLKAFRLALGQRGLAYMVGVTLLLVFAGGAAIALLEDLEGGFWSGLWWGIVTATTVGYGDIAPETFEGRVIAVALMIAGVGLVATVAASVAAYFVGKEEESELAALETRLQARLDRLEALVVSLGGNADDALGDSSTKGEALADEPLVE